MIRPKCTKCNTPANRHGFTKKGTPRFSCKNNNCDVTTFTHKFSDKVVKRKKMEKQIIQLYLEGISIPLIAKLSNSVVSEKTVRNRVDKIRKRIQSYRNNSIEIITAYNLENALSKVSTNHNKFEKGFVVISLDVSNPYSMYIGIDQKKKNDGNDYLY